LTQNKHSTLILQSYSLLCVKDITL